MHTSLHTPGPRCLIAQLLGVGLLASGCSASQAGPQRTWQIHEFTRVALVAREAGSDANQHPARLAPEALREQLARVHLVAGGKRLPLFAGDELAELAGPLSQALESADPGDDVLLLSSARRESGLLGSPTAITARLFVQGGALQLIVRDARFAFYDAYRGTQAAPRFSYGSRSEAAPVVLESAGAASRRTDWLSLGTAPSPAAAKPAEPDMGAEQRLETLKRLRDKGLITEDEHQQKRKEILQTL
jgi:hypothetical protein